MHYRRRRVGPSLRKRSGNRSRTSSRRGRSRDSIARGAESGCEEGAAEESECAARWRQQKGRFERMRVRDEDTIGLLGKPHAMLQRLNSLLSMKAIPLTHFQKPIALLREELTAVKQ
jgi:hypothetical protein